MKKALVGTVAIFVMGLMLVPAALAAPSQKFFERGGEVYDSFGVCRTRSTGEQRGCSIALHRGSGGWTTKRSSRNGFPATRRTCRASRSIFFPAYSERCRIESRNW